MGPGRQSYANTLYYSVNMHTYSYVGPNPFRSGHLD